MSTSLPPAEVQDLLELRALLDRALQECRSGAHLTQITAVILLDGVVERALLMACGKTSTQITENEKFENIYSKLKGTLSSQWSGSGWVEVRQLRRVRNLAQHVGVSSDSQRIPIWADSAEKFIRSLILAAYGEDLSTLRLASLVLDPDIRSNILAAEAALDRSDPQIAFDQAVRALDTARARWAGGYGSSIFRPQTPVNLDPLDKYLRSVADGVRLVSDIQFFAVDPSMYVWLQDLRASRGDYVTQDEASRVLTFVFWWVARWQSFDSAVDPERVKSRLSERRPKRDVACAAEVDTIVEFAPYVPGKYRLKIQLKELPPDPEFDSWSSILCEEFRLCSIIDTRLIAFGYDGILDVEVAESVEPAAFVTSLTELLEAHERHFKETMRNRALSLERHALRTNEVEEYIKGKGQLPSWLSEIALSVDPFEPQATESLIVVYSDDGRMVDGTATDLIRAKGGGLWAIGKVNGSYEIHSSPTGEPAETIVDRLFDLGEKISESVRSSKEASVEAEGRRSDLENRFRAAVEAQRKQ